MTIKRYGWADQGMQEMPNVGTYVLYDDALATPAPDAVQEAARVPEIAALIEAAKSLVCHDGWGTVNYTDNGMWFDAETLRAALRAIAGDRT